MAESFEPSHVSADKSHRGRWRRWLSVLTVALLSMLSGAVMAAPAGAVPVYEIDGRWAPGTPTEMASGEVVTAEWRVNVNDSEAAPSNDPVDNVTFTVTLVNGVFSAIPDVCLTTGVDPVSSISADGATLVCNLGTQDQGSAHVIQTAIVAEGGTGDEVSASATIGDETAEVSPIIIDNPFAMDIRWQSPTNTVVWADDYVDIDVQWTLFLQRGSDPGPDTVSYTLNLTNSAGAPIEVGPQVCTPFTDGVASGHPWSGGAHPADQLAPAATCSLAPTGTPGQFTLTLSDIDYSQELVPARDSAGQALPLDRSAIASGSVWFRILSGANNSVTLTSSAPTYTAPTGDTATDDPSNNQSNKTWTRGGWSNAWQPEASGYPTPSWWSDEFRVTPGTSIQSATNLTYGLGDAPADAEFGQCVILDTRFIDYRWTQFGGNWGGVTIPGAVLEYYTGADPLVDPTSASYDPNLFRCDADPAGWTTTAPTDPTTVAAVRVTYPFSSIDGINNVALAVGQQVQADTPVGQDVWQWGAALVNGVWQHPTRSTDPADRGPGPLTPDARYPFIGSGRDIVRIIGVTPDISKTADRTSARPGVPVNFTLTYTANGSGAVEETVDDYTIVDTLPVGVTYVTGSATPEPAITVEDGQQVLTWVLDGVPTNTVNALTYQAVVDASVPPATRLTNTVTSAVGGETSAPATAQVTVSANGSTLIGKTTDQWFIANPDGSGNGEGSWTVTLASEDPQPQAFTDTIDILPYNGDGRGTSFEGTYSVTSVDADGATVYYTDADPTTLSDDPADASNGAAGDPTGNTVGWTTTPIEAPTAIRVIGGELAPGATTSFVITIATEGAAPGDVWVNRAQARAEHTELVMRTSEPLTMGTYYSASLKKYVLDSDGEWRDAQDASDYPTFRIGDTVTYRVIVENTGQGTLTGIVVSDDQQPELGEFVIDTLEPGESQIHEYEVVLDETYGTSVVNTACATADQPADAEEAPSINCDPAGIDITNYTVVKTAEQPDGSVVQPGETVTYTVTVTQEGSAPADAAFVDDLAEVLDDAVYNEDVEADTGTAEFVDGAILWSGTVPVGGTATVTYSVTVKEMADLLAEGDFSLRNVVTSDGCVPADGEFPDCTTGHLAGGYVYSKTSDPETTSTVSPGQDVTYTVQVEHVGQAPVPGATVTDDLSAVLDDAEYNDDASATAGAVEVDGETLTWTGDLAVGDVVTLTYSVTVLETGDNTLLNVVTSPDERGICVPAADENPDCTTTHTKGWYVYAKTADPETGSTVAVDDTVTYTVTVSQQGAAEMIGATIVDDLSDVLDDADYNGDATASAGSIEVDGETLTWTGDLAVGAVVTITYSVTVEAEGDGTLLNVVSSPDERGACVEAADGNPDCTTTHDKAESGSSSLPRTGAEIVGALALTGLLTLLGLGLLAVRRRVTG